MEPYTPDDLLEARRSIASTCVKCEKALLKLRPGTPQHTLTVRRIRAFQIALALLEREAARESDGNTQSEGREMDGRAYPL